MAKDKDFKSTEEVPARIEYDKADDVVFVLSRDGVYSSLPHNAVPDTLEEFLELPPHHHYGVLMERLLKDHEALDTCAILYSWICENEFTQDDLLRAREVLETLGLIRSKTNSEDKPEEEKPVFCDWLKVDE